MNLLASKRTMIIASLFLPVVATATTAHGGGHLKRRRLSTAIVPSCSLEGETHNNDDNVDHRLFAECAHVQHSLAARIHNQHFGLTAAPVLENDVNLDAPMLIECPTLYLHNDLFVQVICRLDDLQHGLELGTYKFGNCTLSVIMEAFDRASNTASSNSATAGHGICDLLDNNCGTFVLSMMEELNIPLAAEIVWWATHGLLRSSGLAMTIRDLRSHVAFPACSPNGVGAADSLLMMEFAMRLTMMMLTLLLLWSLVP